MENELEAFISIGGGAAGVGDMLGFTHNSMRVYFWGENRFLQATLSQLPWAAKNWWVPISCNPRSIKECFESLNTGKFQLKLEFNSESSALRLLFQ